MKKENDELETLLDETMIAEQGGNPDETPAINPDKIIPAKTNYDLVIALILIVLIAGVLIWINYKSKKDGN